MTSTNDGKDVKSNQTSGHKSKTYYIELYTSLEKALSSDNSLEERTKHVCEAWRRVYSLYQHSATSTHPHLLSWLQRHTASTVLQSKWGKSKNEQARLTEAIDALVAEVTAASASRTKHPWEEILLQRAAWFRKALENPWDNPVLKSLINPNSEPVTDQQVLEWLISEHGIVLVTRLQQMVAAGKCDDLALLLASAVMDRARAAMPHLSDDQADTKVDEEDSESFVSVLEREASFTSDEWEMLMDIELVLLLKTDKRPRCIELAKLAPLRHGFKMVERLRKRLETSPRDKKLWKHAKDVATIVTQVLIARCMVLKTCSGLGRDALYWCARALARLLPPPALRATSTALTLPASTARHLHTFCTALSAECKELKTDVEMKPFICELYVRAITAGMNELEQLKLNADKEAEARLYEQTLAGWFTQLGGRLTDSVRLRAECALTAFSVHPSRKHYERVANTQPPRALAKQESTESTPETTSEYGSWANDSRTQSNLVKTSETLRLKQSEQHQANVLSTAILTEGEALGLEPELCQDLAVLLSGPRVKTLSWDMDREVLLENCRAYLEKTHGGTRAVTTELKYLNLDLNEYRHLPEEEDDENDVFYGIEKGYEHEVQFEEPEEIWQNAFFDPEMTESANDSEVDRLSGKKNSKASSSEEDEDPLSTIAEAKKEKKKRAKEKDREQKKKKAPKADARDDSKERRKEKRKSKKERKQKSEQTTTGSLNSLLGMKIAKTSSQILDGEKRVRKKERRRESTFSYVNVTDSDFDNQEKSLHTYEEPNVLVDGVFSMDELKSPERLSVDSQSLDNTKTTIKSEIVNPVIKTIKARPASSLSATTSSDSDVARSKSPYLTPNQLAQKHVASSKVKSSLSKLLQFRRNQHKIKPAPRPPPAHMTSTPTNSLVGMKIYNPDEVPKVYLNKKQSKQLEALSNDVSNLLKEVTPDHTPKTPYSEPEDKQRQNAYNVQKHSQQYNPMYISPNQNDTRTDYLQHNQLTVDSFLQSIYASPPKTELTRPTVLNHSPLKPPVTYQPFHKSMQNLSTEKNDASKKPLLINDPNYFSHQHAKTSASQLSPRIISNTVIKPPSQTAVEDFPKFHGNIHRTYMTKPTQNTIQTTTKSDVARCGKQFSSMQNINEFPSSSQSDKRHIITPNNMLHGPAKTYSVISHSDAIKSTHALQTNRHVTHSSSNQNQEDARTQKSENDFDEFFKELMKTINAGSNSPDKNVTVALNKDVKVSSVQTPVVKKTDTVIPQSAKNIQQKKTENAPNTFSRLSYMHKNKVENKVKLTDSVTLELNRKIVEHKLTKAKYIKNEVTLSRVGPKSTNTQDVTQMIRKIEPSNSSLQKNNPVLTSMLESPGTPKILNYSNMPTTTRSFDQPNREDADLLLLLHNQNIIKPNTNVTPSMSDGFSQTETNSQTNVESKQQNLIGTKVKNINILDNCSKKDKSDDEWKRVMDAIIATKTEPLGPNALDLALKKDQRRHIQNKPSGKPRMPGQSSSQMKSSDLKKREHISAKTNSTARKSSTDRHSEIKKPRESEIIKKISPEMLNRIQVQNKQHINMAKEHSVIPNSDYDILGELLDDDLRQELGEISSDEDAYGVQSALVKGKNHKNIPKSNSICKTMHKKPQTNAKTLVCKNQSNPNMTENLRTIVNSSTPYSNVIMNSSHPTTHIDNRLTNVSSAAQYVPSTTVITNQVAQDTANNILTHVEANQYMNNIVPTNVIITSVPQPPPVVVIRQNLVYDPYPTIRIHENQINPTVFAVNTAPNLAVYQTTQFAAPIINPIIIGNATTNTVPNVMQEITPDMKEDLNITNEDNISLETALRLSGAISEREPIMDFNMNRNSERKVLSQVHENHTNDEEPYINVPDVRLKSAEDAERIKLKRQSFINRNVNHTGDHPPIALSYTPLCNKVTLGKLLQQETPKNGTINPNIKLMPNTNEIEVINPIEKSLTSEPNENIETTNQTNAKENKKTCRRIWLRSSNKMPNEEKTGVAHSRVALKRKPIKPQEKNAIENTTEVVNQNKDTVKIPKRITNRKVNKKKTTKSEPTRSTETQPSLDLNELIDFEKELDSSIVLKMPTQPETITKSTEKPQTETEVGVNNTEDTLKSNNLPNTLEPTVVIEKLKNRLGDQLIIKNTTVKTAAKEVNVIVKNQNLEILKESICKESLIAKESRATSNKVNTKEPKPALRSSLRIETNKLKPMLVVDENVIKQTPLVDSKLALDESDKVKTIARDDEKINTLKPVVVVDEKVIEKTPVVIDKSNKLKSVIPVDDQKTNNSKPLSAVDEQVIDQTPLVGSSLVLEYSNKLNPSPVDDQKTKVIEQSPLVLDESNKVIRVDDQKINKFEPVVVKGEKVIEKTPLVCLSLGLEDGKKLNPIPVDDQKTKVIEQNRLVLDESNKIIPVDNKKFNQFEPMVVLGEKVIEKTSVGSTMLLDESNKSNILVDEQKTNNSKPVFAVDEQVVDETPVIGSSFLDDSNKLNATDVQKKVVEQTPLVRDESNKLKSIIDDEGVIKQTSEVSQPLNDQETMTPQETPEVVPQTDETHECHTEQLDTNLPEIGKDQTNDKSQELTMRSNENSKESTTVAPLNEYITTLKSDTTPPVEESKINHESDSKPVVQLPPQEGSNVNTNPVLEDDDDVQIIETPELNIPKNTKVHIDSNEKLGLLDKTTSKDQQKTINATESLECREKFNDFLNEKSVTDKIDVNEYLESHQSKLKQSNTNTNQDIKKNVADTETSKSKNNNLSLKTTDNKEKATIYTKGDIRIEEVPLEDPNKKLLRILLPNGKVFKATIYGNMQGDVDSLFATPTMRAILSGATRSDGKRYTVNYKQIQKTINGDKKVREIQDLDVKEADVASRPVDTVNLISDDEEEETRSFKTEFGKYTTKLDHETVDAHQKKFDQKCEVKMIREDLFKSNRTKPKVRSAPSLQNSLMTRNKSKLLAVAPTNTNVISENKPDVANTSQDITTPLLKQESKIKIPIAPDTPLLTQVSDIPKISTTDVIEIDDSSNDSLEIQAQETVTENIEPANVTAMASLLLQSLGVETEKPAVPIKKGTTVVNLKSALLQDLGIVPVITPVIDITTNEDDKTDNQQQNETCNEKSVIDFAQKENQISKTLEQFNIKKSAVKLIKCDELVKSYELMKSMKKCYVKIERFNTLETTSSAPSENTDFNCDNVEDFIEFDIDDPCSSPQLSRCPSLSILNNWDDDSQANIESRITSPVMEIYDTIVNLRNKHKTKLIRESEKMTNCDSEWIMTKFGYSAQEFMLKSSDKLTGNVTLMNSDEIKDGYEKSMAYETPKLLSITLKYLQDNPEILYRFELMRKRGMISNITLPNKLKRKTEVVYDSGASKILKLEKIALNTINSSLESLAVIFPIKVEYRANRQTLINVENNNVTITEALPKYECTVVAKIDDENQTDELIKTDNGIQTELSNKGFENKLEEVVYIDDVLPSKNDDINTNISEVRDVTSPSLLCDYTENVEEKPINMDLINKENDELYSKEIADFGSDILDDIQNTTPAPQLSPITETTNEGKPIITNDSDEETSPHTPYDNNETSMKETGDEEKAIITDDFHQSTNDYPSDEETSPLLLCDNNEIGLKETGDEEKLNITPSDEEKSSLPPHCDNEISSKETVDEEKQIITDVIDQQSTNDNPSDEEKPSLPLCNNEISLKETGNEEKHVITYYILQQSTIVSPSDEEMSPPLCDNNEMNLKETVEEKQMILDDVHQSTNDNLLDKETSPPPLCHNETSLKETSDEENPVITDDIHRQSTIDSALDEETSQPLLCDNEIDLKEAGDKEKPIITDDILQQSTIDSTLDKETSPQPLCDNEISLRETGNEEKHIISSDIHQHSINDNALDEESSPPPLCDNEISSTESGNEEKHIISDDIHQKSTNDNPSDEEASPPPLCENDEIYVLEEVCVKVAENNEPNEIKCLETNTIEGNKVVISPKSASDSYEPTGQSQINIDHSNENIVEQTACTATTSGEPDYLTVDKVISEDNDQTFTPPSSDKIITGDKEKQMSLDVCNEETVEDVLKLKEAECSAALLSETDSFNDVTENNQEVTSPSALSNNVETGVEQTLSNNENNEKAPNELSQIVFGETPVASPETEEKATSINVSNQEATDNSHMGKNITSDRLDEISIDEIPDVYEVVIVDTHIHDDINIVDTVEDCKEIIPMAKEIQSECKDQDSEIKSPDFIDSKKIIFNYHDYTKQPKKKQKLAVHSESNNTEYIANNDRNFLTDCSSANEDSKLGNESTERSEVNKSDCPIKSKPDCKYELIQEDDLLTVEITTENDKIDKNKSLSPIVDENSVVPSPGCNTDNDISLKGYEFEDIYVFPLSQAESNNSNVSNDSLSQELNTENAPIPNDLHDIDYQVKEPEVTYSRKRKMSMRDVRVIEKKYRKGKNIDCSKQTQFSIVELAYSKEYKRLLDYCSSVKFSYSRPFHKECVELEELMGDWPINSVCCDIPNEVYNEHLFVDLEDLDNYQPDPTTQTFVEEISYEYEKTNAAPENQNEASEANFNMGFGEGSGRVIQILNIEGESNISAATLSDVKQSQPVSRSVDPDDCNNTTNNDDQISKIRRHVNFIRLRDKVRQFFEKTSVELKSEWKQQNTKDLFQEEFPFGLCSLEYLHPLPTNAIVHVVQVGQLPVSAAAQNPVTCDPRVTQVSDASPSQCSVDNSPNDDSQSEIKTEYTELTTADLTLPLQEYAQQNQASLASQENVELTEQTISLEMEIKAEESSEIKQEMPDINEEKSNSSDTDLHTLANATTENMEYSFEKNTSKSDSSSVNYDSSEQNSSETFAQQRQQNGTAEKTDQIAHAMNAAGITTTSETVNNTRAHALVNILSQKIRQGSVNTTQTTTNTYSKATSINAMSLQQALAQILPPPLNQTGSNDNQQSTSVGPQVLHIVQGKNASGNQITLVDNSQQSVISGANATQVLHIVQNKNATTGQASNGTLTSQGNSFSGLSLVDAGLQQGGNQLLHIVNTGNQKTASPGQLLKRVNLLTNLTNVQGSNEQKMVQFVCKSADGKAIQLNAPHQRSMVLRLQPIETSNVHVPSQKPAETQELSPSPNGSASSKESASQQEIKSRSIYEENYAKFIQNSSSKTPSLEKSTSLPKFNQAFGKPVFQEGSQKQGEAANNNSHLPPVNSNSENAECPANDNAINMEHMSNISSPPLLIRKPVVTTQSQSNIVQQIKQTIAPMNIQTMHGGVIYTRQIPVNIGGGQTINLITVPSTELINDEASKTQCQSNQGEMEPSIIKIVPQNQATSNTESSQEESNNHASGSSENAQTPQPQPVLTQMRIKLPMLSKAPQMVPGARVVRPSFFQIQRNVIGGANQPVYQQLVLTAAPPLGQQTIRLPAQASRPVKVPSENQSSSSESQMSSSTLEQLREFDMVLEQVKERSTSTPSANTNSTSFKIHTSSADTTDSNNGNCSTESGPQVLYSIGNNQSLNVAYVNRKTTVTTPTTSTYVRSPDSSGIADSPTSSSHSQIPHTVTSDSSPTEMSSQSKPAKVGSKSKSRPKTTSNPPNTLKLNSSVPPKTSSQKPLEDEQTTQRILYILAEYKEQVENSPDKDKPAPRRRSNPPSNPGSSKRKKSSSSRRSGTRDMSPVHGEDTCRTMGSEDSSCGTSQGDCTESCLDSHSPQDSPRKVARKITFDQDLTVTQPRPQPQRNVIVADGQTITVARGTTGKPATAVLMPANYILPVSMVKGGQQIAIVTNRGPKLLTVGGEGGATNALLLQRLIGPAGLKPVLTRPGVRHVRLPTAALHNLQAFNLRATVQPPDSTASPTPGPTPPELVDTRANSSPWKDRDEVKPERGSSPEGSEPWNLPSTDAHEYTYEETVRTDNMDRTVLDPIPDRYSPDMEAQRIFDKMFDVDSKKSYTDSRDDSPRCAYDIDPSECDDKAYQVVQRKDGSQRQHRLSHVSAAALRHKYAMLEHELRLQKSLSEECEDLGVDSPSASELFPEAELLFANSPAHEHNQEHHSHTPQPHQSSVPQPDMDDQIATDHLIPREIDVNLGLGDVGIVAVSEDGSATIALDQEEFARSHPNTTFHSEPTDGEVQPFTITGLKGRHITSTIFHSNSAPATVLMTAPQATVISQAPEHSVKYEIENMINSMPSSHNNDINLPSVLVKDDGLTRYDSILTDSRELHLTNTTSAIVHSSGNATQVIRRVCYEDDKRERDARYLIDEPDNLIAGDDAKMIAEDSSRDATLESMADVDDDRSSPERHAELFWESNSASERSESRRPLDFSSDSDKCCKSPSFDETNSTDSSGVGTHMRLDSVIKEARGRERSGSADGSSADDTHPPLRTYPPKRLYHPLEGEAERSLSGKTRAGERSPDSLEVRRRASGRGVVKRGCHCCNGSPAPPRPKKPRQRKPTLDFTNN